MRNCFERQYGGGEDSDHVSVAQLITCFFQTTQEFCEAVEWNNMRSRSMLYVERSPVFASPFEELIKTETTLLLHMWIVQIGI